MGVVSKLPLIDIIIKYILLQSSIDDSKIKIYHHSGDNGLHYPRTKPTGEGLGIVSQQTQPYYSTASTKCKGKITFVQLPVAKRLGICIANQWTDNIQLHSAKYGRKIATNSIEQCISEIRVNYSYDWCDSAIRNLANDILIRLERKYAFADRQELLNIGLAVKNSNKQNSERFRTKRDGGSAAECEEKLQNSLQCYKNELSNLSDTFSTSQTTSQQHDAGCNLIRNILNDCDKNLCSSSPKETDAAEYGQYIQAILPNFNRNNCRNIFK